MIGKCIVICAVAVSALAGPAFAVTDDGGQAFPCGPTNCVQPQTQPQAPASGPTAGTAGYYDGAPVNQYAETVTHEQVSKGQEAPGMTTQAPVLRAPLPSPESMTQADYEAGLCANLAAAKPWINWGCE